MKIWIETDTLLSPDSQTPYRRGTLYGLKRLEQMGHDVGFATSRLNEQQLQLLQQEDIHPDGCTASDNDYSVRMRANQIAVFAGDSAPVETADDWIRLSDRICFPSRRAEVQRKTGETDISVTLNLDGTGSSDINTGLAFFDHMLDQIARHGLVDLELSCNGDLEVDEHHTIEDTAIALGEAVAQALGTKTGIKRYSFVLPMDESQAVVALDLSGRPYFVFEGEFKREYVGDFPTEMLEHFFHTLAMNLNATLHITVKGSNEHHKIEACFKGFARALRESVTRSERTLNLLPSSKGTF